MINDYINRIINIDCIEGMKNIPDNSIDLIVADPPYYQIVSDKWDNQWKNKEDYIDWSKKWITEVARILKNDGSFYCWIGIDTLCEIKELISEHLIFKSWITWKKQRGYGTQKNWMFVREEILFFVKSNDYIFNPQYYDDGNKYNLNKSTGFPMKNGRYSGEYLKNRNGLKRVSNIWVDIIEESLDTSDRRKAVNMIKDHYTPKPLKGIERIIKASSQENDIILDPFMGSGTTGVAAKRLNRNYIGFEIDHRYCDLAEDRISRDIIINTDKLNNWM